MPTMTSPRRPPRPRKEFPYIRAIWSGGTWKWRAVVQAGARQRVGTLRASQEAAYDDARLLRVAGEAAARGLPQTLGEGLERAVLEAEASGVTAATVNGAYRAPAVAVLKFLGPRTALRAIDADEVCKFITRTLAAGRKPTTLKNSYLRLLRLALEAGGLSGEPVRVATRRMRTALKDRPELSAWFSPDEVGVLLARIRTYEGDRPIPTRERHADLIEVVVCTGIRSAELARVLVGDFNAARGTLAVREAKDVRRPREQPLPPNAVDCLRRLTAGRKSTDPLVPGGMRALNAMYERWKKRLDEPRLNGRALRRSYGSGLDLIGASKATIKDGLGHHPNSSQTDRYLRSQHGILRDAVTRLAERFDAGMGE